MSKYKFRDQNIDIDELILNSVGTEYVQNEMSDETKIVLFHNGDTMTIHKEEGNKWLEWEPVRPGESISGSKLNMRFHQWYGKGIIVGMEEPSSEGT